MSLSTKAPRNITISVLKEGPQPRKAVELEDGVTVQDVLKICAQFQQVDAAGLYAVEEKFGMLVKLNKNEVPNDHGALMVGGLEEIDGIPDDLLGENRIAKPRLREELTLEEAMQMQTEFAEMYVGEMFQKTIKKLQQPYLDGKKELKLYRRQLPDVIRPYQAKLFAKWNFGKGPRAALAMQAAFRPHDDNQEVGKQAAVLNNLLGIDNAWAAGIVVREGE